MSKRSLYICLLPLIFIRCRPDDEHARSQTRTSLPDDKSEEYTPRAPHDLEEQHERPTPDEPCSARKPNLIRNSEFNLEPEECGWRVIDETDWGVTVYQECGGMPRDCSAYLETEVWGDPWIAALVQTVRLRTLTSYRLSFSASADLPRELTVALRAEGDAPEDTFFLRTIEAAPQWQSCAFEFDGPVFDADATLTFAFGGSSAGLSLDSVSLLPSRD